MPEESGQCLGLDSTSEKLTTEKWDDGGASRKCVNEEGLSERLTAGLTLYKWKLVQEVDEGYFVQSPSSSFYDDEDFNIPLFEKYKGENKKRTRELFEDSDDEATITVMSKRIKLLEAQIKAMSETKVRCKYTCKP